jgi:hypothetical protein
VKRFLETLGFDVKGEICGCDLVALRGDEPPLVVIGELKLSFNLELVLQGINRTAACDEIWLAVRTSARAGRERDPRVRREHGRRDVEAHRLGGLEVDRKLISRRLLERQFARFLAAQDAVNV